MIFLLTDNHKDLNARTRAPFRLEAARASSFVSHLVARRPEAVAETLDLMASDMTRTAAGKGSRPNRDDAIDALGYLGPTVVGAMRALPRH